MISTPSVDIHRLDTALNTDHWWNRSDHLDESHRILSIDGQAQQMFEARRDLFEELARDTADEGPLGLFGWNDAERAALHGTLTRQLTASQLADFTHMQPNRDAAMAFARTVIDHLPPAQSEKVSGYVRGLLETFDVLEMESVGWADAVARSDTADDVDERRTTYAARVTERNRTAAAAVAALARLRDHHPRVFDHAMDTHSAVETMVKLIAASMIATEPASVGCLSPEGALNPRMKVEPLKSLIETTVAIASEAGQCVVLGGVTLALQELRGPGLDEGVLFDKAVGAELRQALAPLAGSATVGPKCDVDRFGSRPTPSPAPAD